MVALVNVHRTRYMLLALFSPRSAEKAVGYLPPRGAAQGPLRAPRTAPEKPCEALYCVTLDVTLEVFCKKEPGSKARPVRFRTGRLHVWET